MPNGDGSYSDEYHEYHRLQKGVAIRAKALLVALDEHFGKEMPEGIKIHVKIMAGNLAKMKTLKDW